MKKTPFAVPAPSYHTGIGCRCEAHGLACPLAPESKAKSARAAGFPKIEPTTPGR